MADPPAPTAEQLQLKILGAALINPVMSSWMALRESVSNLPDNYSVLILGATGMSGRAAVTVARTLSAGRVVGAARDEATLKIVEGLDSYVVLRDPVEETDFSSVGHVDVVLDYVWGATAVAVLGLLKPERITQFVNIGSLGGDEVAALPAQVVRNKAIRLSGSAPGAWPMPALFREMGLLMQTAASMKRPAIVMEVPLSKITEAWSGEEYKGKRIVFVP